MYGALSETWTLETRPELPHIPLSLLLASHECSHVSLPPLHLTLPSPFLSLLPPPSSSHYYPTYIALQIFQPSLIRPNFIQLLSIFSTRCYITFTTSSVSTPGDLRTSRIRARSGSGQRHSSHQTLYAFAVLLLSSACRPFQPIDTAAPDRPTSPLDADDRTTSRCLPRRSIAPCLWVMSKMSFATHPDR